MNRILPLLLFSIVSAHCSWSQNQKISFYFSAHPDDWQLFMGVNAFEDIADAITNNNKVVFIYTTAGEYNCYNLGVNASYYLARQDGANRSVQFCADVYSPHALWTSSMASISGLGNHSILRSAYKNVVCYYLRLPDGCFEHTKMTLQKLAGHEIRSLQAVDSSTTYRSYEDLVRTVTNIVDFETNSAAQPDIWMNASDWDETINPGDHPDHVQTGKLATEVAGRLDYANVALFEGYNSCREVANLSPNEIAMEAALQSHVSFGLTHEGWGSEWDADSSCGHVEWTSRNYYRVYTTATKARVSNNYLAVNPNPINRNINLTYKVFEKGPVSISLYDSYGNLKATLVDENKEEGIYTINYEAQSLATGCYLVCARFPGHINTLKIMKL